MNKDKSKVSAVYSGSYTGDDGEKRMIVSIFYDSLPLDGGVIETQLFQSEEEEIKDRVLKKIIEIVSPLSESVVVSEGVAFFNDPESILEKLSWVGPEIAEEY